VNQDDPGTYHLFYADGEGHPGTDLTFFPWSTPAPRREGHGLAVEVALTVPPGTLEFWHSRFEGYGVRQQSIERRFGDRALPFTDPHGLRLALVERSDALTRTFAPWDHGPVAVDQQVRGLEGARILERDAAETAQFAQHVLGFRRIGTESGWERHGVGAGGSGEYVDIREDASTRRGAWGTGSVHHLAWRVDDEAHQAEMRARVEEARRRPTPVIDRFWFKSVYFLEPGGVLFELATDGPGFAVDEAADRLGESLVLPPWLEPQRSAIEEVLPPLTLPQTAV
jgi:glyoxalase family protein